MPEALARFHVGALHSVHAGALAMFPAGALAPFYAGVFAPFQAGALAPFHDVAFAPYAKSTQGPSCVHFCCKFLWCSAVSVAGTSCPLMCTLRVLACTLEIRRWISIGILFPRAHSPLIEFFISFKY